MKKSLSNAKPTRTRSVNFRGGVRGKHYERYQASRVTVELDPDIAAVFPDSASVNTALRQILVNRATGHSEQE
jgi:hypothetical protein